MARTGRERQQLHAWARLRHPGPSEAPRMGRHISPVCSCRASPSRSPPSHARLQLLLTDTTNTHCWECDGPALCDHRRTPLQPHRLIARRDSVHGARHLLLQARRVSPMIGRPFVLVDCSSGWKGMFTCSSRECSLASPCSLLPLLC